MPAPLTHFAIARITARRFIHRKSQGNVYFQSTDPLDQHEGISRYVFMGALGPDLPYFHDVDLDGVVHRTRMGKSKYADLFHYNKQGEFIVRLVLRAKRPPKRAPKGTRERVLAYALGHATHLAADTMLHPYVNLFAGKYHKQTIKDIHRISEMHQDSDVATRGYFARKSIRNQRALFSREEHRRTHSVSYIQDSWSLFIPASDLNEHVHNYRSPGLMKPTRVPQLKAVLKLLEWAFNDTHGVTPNEEYWYDSYWNLENIVLQQAYDFGVMGPPEKPHRALVRHQQLIDGYYSYMGKAVKAAEDACAAVIELYDSNCSGQDRNRFRSRVRNWNMDTGHWTDVDLVKNDLRVVWRHSWCDNKTGAHHIPLIRGNPVPKNKQVVFDKSLRMSVGMEVDRGSGLNSGAEFFWGNPPRSQVPAGNKRQVDDLHLSYVGTKMLRNACVSGEARKPYVLGDYDEKTGTTTHKAKPPYPTEEMVARIHVFVDDKCMTGESDFDSIKSAMKPTETGVEKILIRLGWQAAEASGSGRKPAASGNKKRLVIKDCLVDGVVHVRNGKRLVQTAPQ